LQIAVTGNVVQGLLVQKHIVLQIRYFDCKLQLQVM